MISKSKRREGAREKTDLVPLISAENRYFRISVRRDSSVLSSNK